jgi:hypothetical protein
MRISSWFVTVRVNEIEFYCPLPEETRSFEQAELTLTHRIGWHCQTQTRLFNPGATVVVVSAFGLKSLWFN